MSWVYALAPEDQVRVARQVELLLKDPSIAKTLQDLRERAVQALLEEQDPSKLHAAQQRVGVVDELLRELQSIVDSGVRAAHELQARERRAAAR